MWTDQRNCQVEEMKCKQKQWILVGSSGFWWVLVGSMIDSILHQNLPFITHQIQEILLSGLSSTVDADKN